MEAEHLQARGRYHAQGWTVDLRGGARSTGSRLATLHETFHDRLQFTTIYGLVVQALWKVGQVRRDTSWTVRGDQLLLGALRTHEEFAAWSTEVVAGAGLAELRNAYPTYAQHADRARSRLVGVRSGYLQAHAVSAIYRAAMQPAQLVDLLGGLAEVLPSKVDRSARPDYRVAVLTHALNIAGWPASTPAGEVKTVGDYIEERNDDWEMASRTFYEHAADLLNVAGCPTLPYEGQRAHLARLHEATETAAGRSINLAPGVEPSSPLSDLDIVLRALESERVSFADEPHRVKLSVTDVSPVELTCGHTEAQRHLFLAVRTRPLDVEDASAPAGERSAVLRAPRLQDGQRGVFELDVTEHLEVLTTSQVSVVSNVSLRTLSDPGTVAWLQSLGQRLSTVLVDLPPTACLRQWLADPRTGGVWAVAPYTAGGAEAMVLGWQLYRSPDANVDAADTNAASVTPAGLSRLHLTLVSPTYPTALALWLDGQPGFSSRFERDDRLLELHAQLVNLTVGHLLAEESDFGFDDVSTVRTVSSTVRMRDDE